MGNGFMEIKNGMMYRLAALLAIIVLVIGAPVYSAQAAVTANITITGSENLGVVNASSLLNINMEVNPGDMDGQEAEWWLIAYSMSSNAWYYYDFSNSAWMTIGAVAYPVYVGTISSSNQLLDIKNIYLP
jgi:hypothetical protein